MGRCAEWRVSLVPEFPRLDQVEHLLGRTLHPKPRGLKLHKISKENKKISSLSRMALT